MKYFGELFIFYFLVNFLYVALYCDFNEAIYYYYHQTERKKGGNLRSKKSLRKKYLRFRKKKKKIRKINEIFYGVFG